MGHPPGTLCNQCQSGYYLVASGERRGACEPCGTRVSRKAIALAVLLLCLAAGYLLLRSDLPCARRAKAYFGDEERGRWWREQGKTLWLAAQTFTLFLGLEAVAMPAPFSWLVSAMDFATLGPFAALFFSPCASRFPGGNEKNGSRRRRKNGSRRRRVLFR